MPIEHGKLPLTGILNECPILVQYIFVNKLFVNLEYRFVPPNSSLKSRTIDSETELWNPVPLAVQT